MFKPTEHQPLPLGEEEDDLVAHVHLGNVELGVAGLAPAPGRVVAGDHVGHLGELGRE